ncbi:MAG: helix-turn-helix domain-containing protein [Pedobacter sp.]|nr:MAG: helix-turn-helix domain-containing protein [Pedobacter sp.]
MPDLNQKIFCRQLLKSWVLLSAFFVLLSAHGKAQSYDFRHYQAEQGLSYNTVFNILQDSRGFMWFASKDGLNRFDGYSFKIFRNSPEDTTSIGSNVVVCLFEDRNKTLWIGTSKGLYKYNDTVERFSLVPATRDRYISEIKGDNRGEVSFLSQSLIFRLDKHNSTVKRYSPKQDFACYSMVFSEDGTLWASATDGTLRRYDPLNSSFNSFDLFSHSSPVTSKWIDKVYLTKQNAILVGTSHQGVKLFDIKTKTYKDILTFNPDRTAVFAKNFIHYEGDVYWIATESGVFVYNLKTGSYQHLRKDQGNPYALSDNAVYALAKDKEGGIWVGTYFGGVNYYPKPFTAFEKYFPKSMMYPISGNAVREITSDQNGNLWVATEDAGLNKIDGKTGKITKLIPNGSKNSIAHTNIHGILTVGKEIWVGTYEQGLDRIDIESLKIIKHYSKGIKPGNLKSDFIECIYQTKAGDILVGTSSGLFKYNEQNDSFTLMDNFPPGNHYISIIESAEGTIWAGSLNNGLYFYNPKNADRGRLIHEDGNDKSLSNNFVNSLFIDYQQNLWVTTENGLNKYDAKTKTFDRFDIKDGFPSNVFYRIEQDNAGNMWISTAKGLVNFNPEDKKIKIYTKAYGLLSDQFNYNSSFKDKSGKLYFGSVSGMVAFNPADFKINKIVPPVYITGFQVFNKDLIVGEEVELPYDQSTISIDFAALVYTGYETAEYAYKLEGLDKDFTYLKRNRRVFYTKLAPGTYTFLVKGSNSSGLWSKEAAKLIIVITPPFYLSMWAYIFYVLLLIAGIYLIIIYFDRKAKLKHKRKLEAVENQKEREVYQAKVDSFTHLITIAQSQPDQALLNQLNEYIHENLSNSNLDVDLLAEKMNMSRATFYRKIKGISNLTPNELINITRLKKAAELLINTDLKIQQIASMTGFTSQAQFGRSFAKQFGVTPSEYAKTDTINE